jgi:hypothetical protein
VIAYLRWWWRTRNCAHPEVRRIGGDERNFAYPALWRCLDCGKALNDRPTGAIGGN